jgi:hypothetical protein
MCSKWQDATDQQLSTILVAATMALLGSAVIGFPSRILIDPFLPWIRSRAENLILHHSDDIHISQTLLSAFKTDDLNFIRADSTFWLCFNYVGLTPRDGRCGWIYIDTKEFYDSCEKDLQNDLLPRGDDGNCTGEVRAVLFPDTFALLRNFNPKDWAAAIENILVSSPVRLQPVNMLCAQVVLLDISIHYLLRRGWFEGSPTAYKMWNKETVAVINAIVESWSNGRYPTQNSTSATDEVARSTANDQVLNSTSPAPNTAQHDPQPHSPTPLQTHSSSANTEWNLAGCLEKQADLQFSDDPGVRKEKIRQLAELLELRALFLLHFCC